MPEATVKDEVLRSQFNALQQRMQDYIEEIRRLERYALFASGGVWVWISSQSTKELLWIACLVPPLLCAFLWAKVAFLRGRFDRTKSYVRKIEESVGLGEKGLVWANFPDSGKLSIVTWSRAFWFAIVAGNAVIAWFVFDTL